MGKKILAAIMALSLCVGTLTACGGGGKTETAAPETQAAGETGETKAAGETQAAVDASMYEVTEPITITWWHALEDQYSQTIEDVVKEFEASQDLIKVDVQYIGKYSELNEKLATAQAAGKGLPALAMANTPYVAQYGESGMAEDLTPYIAATGFDIDDFGEGLIKAASYDGKPVSLPFLISTQVVYYNKDMAKELGVTIPEKFSDMDEFLEKVSVVNNGQTERYGTIIPGWDQWYFETFYLNNGVNIVNEDGLSSDLDSEAALKVASTLKDWCDKGYAYFAVGETASDDMRTRFIDGKAFSVLHTSSLYDTYVDRCDFEVGMAWFPGGDDGSKKSEIGGNVLFIPAINDQATKNAAWQFLQFLESKDTNMKWAKETGYMPTRNSVLNTDEGKAFLAEKPEFQCIFDNLNEIQPRIQNVAWDNLATIWKNKMAEMINENKDVTEFMTEMTQEINEVLEDQ